MIMITYTFAVFNEYPPIITMHYLFYRSIENCEASGRTTWNCSIERQINQEIIEQRAYFAVCAQVHSAIVAITSSNVELDDMKV